jgi:hypothetical protein
MTRELTFERTFHIARGRRCGKGLRAGDAPPEQDRRIPRIARLMALALCFDQLIAGGQIANQAQLARLGSVSRARLTQIMNLVLLAPEIQEELLFLSCGSAGRPTIYLCQLQPIAATLDWKQQRRQWNALKGHRTA